MSPGNIGDSRCSSSGCRAVAAFGHQIGVDIGGNAASNLRVVVSPTGDVITAFPF